MSNEEGGGEEVNGVSQLTPADDVEQRPEWLERLNELNSIIAAEQEPLAGNLFYEHEDPDFAGSRPTPVYRAKRDRFRAAVRGRRKLLEVGVNGGHLAFLALTENPELEFHGVDICQHTYVEPAIAWLEREFPGRVHFDSGDSLKVLPALRTRRLKFDFFHIDGAKFNYYTDIVNASRLVDRTGGLVVVDDSEQGAARVALSSLAHFGVITPVPEFPSMPKTEAHRNELIRLLPTSAVKEAPLKIYGHALNMAHRAKALVRNDTEWADYHRPRSRNKTQGLHSG
jgi:hypothetical protein